jgi:hypothetical protein
MLADDDRNDIRIEAALVKLFASEKAWQIADELIQIRGGRGYETAASQAARGERAIPIEQILRDLRINRIFEGSTEIMHLLIAREAVDQHLSVAGDIIDPEARFGRKAKAGLRASGFYARWLPALTVGGGQVPGGYAAYGPLAKHVRYVERATRKLARATFYGMSRWQGKLEYKQGFLARIVDIGAELFAMSASCVRARAERAPTPRAWSWRTSSATRHGTGGGAVHRTVAQHGRRGRRGCEEGARGAVHEAGGGHHGASVRGRLGGKWEPGPSTEPTYAAASPLTRVSSARSWGKRVARDRTTRIFPRSAQRRRRSGAASYARREAQRAEFEGCQRGHDAIVTIAPGARGIAGGLWTSRRSGWLASARSASRSRPPGRPEGPWRSWPADPPDPQRQPHEQDQ